MSAKRKFLLASILSIPILFAVFLFATSRPRVLSLGNGEALAWIGVTTGTNSLSYGSPLETLLGDWIPAKGVNVGPFHWRRPVRHTPFPEADAIAWVALRTTGSNMVRGFYWDGSAVIMSNRQGRSVEIPTARPYRSAANETILQIPLRAFPRDGETVILRLSPPTEKGERRWAEFEFDNPFHPAPQLFRRSEPKTRHSEGAFEFALSAVQEKELVFTLADTNWTVVNCRITDDEGNYTTWSRTMGPNRGEREASVGFDHGLETNRWWRVEASFLRAPYWMQATEDAGRWPEEERRLIHIGQSADSVMCTNTSGGVFRWRYLAGQIQLTREDAPTRPHWIVLSATNETGSKVTVPGGSAWTRRGLDGSEAQMWSIGPGTEFDLEVVCPREVHGEFYVRGTGSWPSASSEQAGRP
jgi:hypothetical protein